MRFSILVALILACAVPAAAQGPVRVPSFDSIELRGGGHVTIRHGATQRVTLVRGSTDLTRFRVDDDGNLRIDACVRSCRNYDLRVEIVTPSLNAVAITGGGAIRTDGAFPARGMLAVAVTGGGSIDVRPIEAGSVAAAIRGGGSIMTRPRNSLAASISGGGSITYWGRPSVTSSINGGGSVRRAAAR